MISHVDTSSARSLATMECPILELCSSARCRVRLYRTNGNDKTALATRFAVMALFKHKSAKIRAKEYVEPCVSSKTVLGPFVLSR